MAPDDFDFLLGAQEPIYSAALQRPQDILCPGSDDETDDTARAAKRRRYEIHGERYLKGEPLRLLSTSLRGPFDKASGWQNPWRRNGQPKTIPVTKPTRKVPTANPSRFTGIAQNTKKEAGSTPWTRDSLLCHIPSPDNYQGPEIPFENVHLATEKRAQIEAWASTIPKAQLTRDEFWAPGRHAHELNDASDKKRPAGAGWLRNEAIKRRSSALALREATTPTKKLITRNTSGTTATVGRGISNASSRLVQSSLEVENDQVSRALDSSPSLPTFNSIEPTPSFLGISTDFEAFSDDELSRADAPSNSSALNRSTGSFKRRFHFGASSDDELSRMDALSKSSALDRSTGSSKRRFQFAPSSDDKLSRVNALSKSGALNRSKGNFKQHFQHRVTIKAADRESSALSSLETSEVDPDFRMGNVDRPSKASFDSESRSETPPRLLASKERDVSFEDYQSLPRLASEPRSESSPRLASESQAETPPRLASESQAETPPRLLAREEGDVIFEDYQDQSFFYRARSMKPDEAKAPKTEREPQSQPTQTATPDSRDQREVVHADTVHHLQNKKTADELLPEAEAAVRESNGSETTSSEASQPRGISYEMNNDGSSPMHQAEDSEMKRIDTTEGQGACSGHSSMLFLHDSPAQDRNLRDEGAAAKVNETPNRESTHNRPHDTSPHDEADGLEVKDSRPKFDEAPGQDSNMRETDVACALLYMRNSANKPTVMTKNGAAEPKLFQLPPIATPKPGSSLLSPQLPAEHVGSPLFALPSFSWSPINITGLGESTGLFSLEADQSKNFPNGVALPNDAGPTKPAGSVEMPGINGAQHETDVSNSPKITTSLKIGPSSQAGTTPISPSAPVSEEHSVLVEDPLNVDEQLSPQHETAGLHAQSGTQRDLMDTEEQHSADSPVSAKATGASLASNQKQVLTVEADQVNPSVVNAEEKLLAHVPRRETNFDRGEAPSTITDGIDDAPDDEDALAEILSTSAEQANGASNENSPIRISLPELASSQVQSPGATQTKSTPVKEAESVSKGGVEFDMPASTTAEQSPWAPVRVLDNERGPVQIEAERVESDPQTPRSWPISASDSQCFSPENNNMPSQQSTNLRPSQQSPWATPIAEPSKAGISTRPSLVEMPASKPCSQSHTEQSPWAIMNSQAMARSLVQPLTSIRDDLSTPQRPKSPIDLQDSDPSLGFSIKSFAKFNTPSRSRRSSQVKHPRLSGNQIPSSQRSHRLAGMASNPWDSARSRSNLRVSFAPLPGDDEDDHEFHARSSARPASPPPQTTPQIGDDDVDDSFQSHFDAMRQRGDSSGGHDETPVPKFRFQTRLLPSQSQQTVASPAVGAMAEAFLDADAQLDYAQQDHSQHDQDQHDNDQHDSPASSPGDDGDASNSVLSPWHSDEEQADEVTDVLQNLDDFLNPRWDLEG